MREFSSVHIATDADAEIARVHRAVASAAHELRQPATVMLAMSELLSRDRRSIADETFDEMIDAISRQAQVLERVTADLLASTQARRGSLDIELERVRLRPLIAGLAMSLSDRVRLVADCPQSLWVLADPARLQQILGNLVSNAVKYGAPPVEITARALDGEVEISVIDHGRGVPAEFIDQLFTQFSRADPAEVNGLGLGLYLVKSLTEAQGGRVQYVAVPAGGSSFCVSLPAAEPPD
jgi:signal transduction histidine kinase